MSIRPSSFKFYRTACVLCLLFTVGFVLPQAPHKRLLPVEVDGKYGFIGLHPKNETRT
jgi:hypothetical protein